MNKRGVSVIALPFYYDMKRYKEGKCSECGNEGPIAYVKEQLCSYCNRRRHARNYAKKDKKVYILKRSPIKPSKRRAKSIKNDNAFYEEVWNSKPHCCEECHKSLPVFNKSYISHIISKGSNVAFRHDKRNINILCFSCHQQWEFGDKRSMRIYSKNSKIIEDLNLEYHKGSVF